MFARKTSFIIRSSCKKARQRVRPSTSSSSAAWTLVDSRGRNSARAFSDPIRPMLWACRLRARRSAALRPALMRWSNTSRSNSARAGTIRNVSLPLGVVVLMFSVRERSSRSRSLSRTVVSMSWRSDRARRPTFQMMTTSPCARCRGVSSVPPVRPCFDYGPWRWTPSPGSCGSTWLVERIHLEMSLLGIG